MAEDSGELLKTLVGMLGENPEEKISAVLSGLGVGEGESEEENKEESETALNEMPDLSALMKMQGLLSQTGGTDERSVLLRALKPFLNDRRRPQVDRALQLLRFAKLAESAKDMNFFK